MAMSLVYYFFGDTA